MELPTGILIESRKGSSDVDRVAKSAAIVERTSDEPLRDPMSMNTSTLVRQFWWTRMNQNWCLN